MNKDIVPDTQNLHILANACEYLIFTGLLFCRFKKKLESIKSPFETIVEIYNVLFGMEKTLQFLSTAKNQAEYSCLCSQMGLLLEIQCTSILSTKNSEEIKKNELMLKFWQKYRLSKMIYSTR